MSAATDEMTEELNIVVVLVAETKWMYSKGYGI
jgi:hypothetical protein